MKFLKTVVAILVSVLLAESPSVFALCDTAPVVAQECGCCACQQIDCCVAQSDSAPEPISATPVRTASQNAFQLIAFFSSLILPLPESVSQPVASTPFASLHATAVPLYEWNCSYLI